MDQQIFNLIAGLFGILLSIIGVCITWWVNNIWAMVKSQQTEINSLHVELVRNYVPRVELQQTFDRIFRKLDEIQSEVTK